MRRRVLRTLLAYLLFAAMFGAGCGLAVTGALAQETPKPEEKPPENPPEVAKPAPGLPEWTDHRPDGPDGLFAPLPADGIFDGAAPAAFAKVVILEVPFADSWHDDPVEDLPAENRVAAHAFRYHLEQRLDYLPNTYQYLPQLDTANYLVRVARHNARLRFGAGFAPGQPPQTAARIDVLDHAARCFGADLVFATAYARGDQPRALCVRYRRDKGVEAAHEFALETPEGQRLVTALPAAAAAACAGLETVKGPDGKVVQLAIAPVPPIAGSDAALRRCVRMREALEATKLTQGWVEYEDLKKLEAPSGRAAMWAMEVFRGLADRNASGGDRDTYLAHCLNAGREGLKQAPNDVLLRGKVCRYATIWFKRDAWALAGLKQALRAQPANAHLLDWHVIIEYSTDRAKQSAWLEKVALPLLHDGRGHYLLATCQFEAGLYGAAVESYKAAIARAPNEYEYHFAMGLCATYQGEQLYKTDLPGAEGELRREQALDAMATAAEALLTAQRLDPSELGWAYEYHVRAATQGYTRLPTNPVTLERVMLSQAITTSLESASRMQKWDKLVEPLIGTYRRNLRRTAREADPASPDYQVWLIARLQFAMTDKNQDDAVQTLRLMRKQGFRGETYRTAMYMYGVMLDKPDADKPAKDD